jgi:hypothetical protein
VLRRGHEVEAEAIEELILNQAKRLIELGRAGW